jgi:hypothetical protein
VTFFANSTAFEIAAPFYGSMSAIIPASQWR